MQNSRCLRGVDERPLGENGTKEGLCWRWEVAVITLVLISSNMTVENRISVWGQETGLRI